MARTYRYYVHPGTMYGISREEFLRRQEKGWRQYESFCDIRFEKADRPSRAHFNFYFASEQQMRDTVGFAALGLAWQGSGTIWLLSTEHLYLKDGITRPYTWHVENLNLHEVGHCLGYDHVEEVGIHEPVMSSNGTAEFFNADEVKRDQKRYGVKNVTRPWYPGDRGIYGDQIRDNEAQRNWHKQQRDNAIKLLPRLEDESFSDWVSRLIEFRTVHQNANLTLLRQQTPLNVAWHYLNGYWKDSGVYGVHVA